MSAHMLTVGYADATGVYLHTGDGYQAQLTPLGRDVAALCDAILRGDVEPCPCGKFACDCDEWGEIMNSSPDDVTPFATEEIPY
jgi:hydrogenase maturation factor